MKDRRSTVGSAAGVKPTRLSPFGERAGAVLHNLGEGSVCLSLQLDEKHTNTNGVMHGGVATALIDEALSLLIGSIRGDRSGTRSPPLEADMSVSFIAAPRAGERIVVEARVLRIGRRVWFGEAEITQAAKGHLIAKGQCTFLVGGDENP